MGSARRTFVGLGVAFVLLEGLLRFFYTSPKTQFIDPVLEIARAPGVVVVNGREGFAWTTIDPSGRVVTPGSPPSGATTRGTVLFLGDSYVEGLQVAPVERLPSRIATALDARVINAAQSGWSPAHHLRFLGGVGQGLVREVAVVQLNDGDLAGLTDRTRFHVPAGSESCEVRLPPGWPPTGPLHELRDALASRSALFYLATSRFQLLVQHQAARARARIGRSGEQASSRDGGEGEGRAMRGCMAALAKAAPHVVFLYLPTLTYGSGARCEPTHPGARETYSGIATALGLQWLDATDALCEAYAREGQPPHGFHNGRVGAGHLNAAGHRAVAAWLAPLVEAGLP